MLGWGVSLWGVCAEGVGGQVAAAGRRQTKRPALPTHSHHHYQLKHHTNKTNRSASTSATACCRSSSRASRCCCSASTRCPTAATSRSPTLMRARGSASTTRSATRATPRSSAPRFLLLVVCAFVGCFGFGFGCVLCFFFLGGGGVLCLLAWLGWCAAVLNHIHCNHPSNEHTKQKTLKKVRDGAKRIVRLKEGEPSGRHVVIVDDLVQSGGTLIECHALLASLGAKHGEERQERRGGCCCSCCFQPRPVPRTALAQNATRTPRRSSQARAAHTPYGRWPLRPWHSNACARAAQGASTWVASRFGWQCPPTQPLARIPFSPPCFSKGEQRRRRRQQPFLARGAPPFYFPPRPRAGRSAAYTYTYLKHTPVSLSHTTHPSKTPTKTTKTNECKSERVRDARRLPQGVVQQVQARRRRCVRVC